LKVQGNPQLLVYADDVNILAGSVHIIKKNAEGLIVATKESGLEVNADKTKYRGADKSLARPGMKQPWKHVRDTRDFNNIEMRAVIKFLFLQGKASKEIHAILTETLAWLPSWLG